MATQQLGFCLLLAGKSQDFCAHAWIPYPVCVEPGCLGALPALRSVCVPKIPKLSKILISHIPPNLLPSLLPSQALQKPGNILEMICWIIRVYFPADSELLVVMGLNIPCDLKERKVMSLHHIHGVKWE